MTLLGVATLLRTAHGDFDPAAVAARKDGRTVAVCLPARDEETTVGTIVVADQVAYVAEVNSTGRIVYGFNWQNPVAGEYTVTVKSE